MTIREKGEYVLGTNDEELMRLGFQHRVWGEQAFALWERAGFAPGQTIVDVGCGPGFATLDLARLTNPQRTGLVPLSADKASRTGLGAALFLVLNGLG